MNPRMTDKPSKPASTKLELTWPGKQNRPRLEPRILLEDVIFDLSGAMQGELRITLDYLIRQTNTRSNMVFPFYFAEGTHVRRLAR